MVAKGSIRVLISIVANLDWPLHQFDMKNTFRHENSEEEVYMYVPPGFEDTKTKGKVCKLINSLYRLKQTPRAWFERFSQAIIRYGFRLSHGDHTLFIKHSIQGKTTALIVYVDNIVLTGNDLEKIMRLKKYLATEFKIKDLGALKFFLGIELARSKHGILFPKENVIDLLEEIGMLGSKAVDTPMEPN